MSKSKMIVRTKFIDRALSLDRGDLLLPGGAVRDFVLLPDAAMADANLRYAADGTHFAPRSSALRFSSH
ncbi:Uncharacterised protein [Escherichia coli]|uniref:Uncharacterized protein n=1 Tax=Escherichia coli TaxID=562 RepID=A0A2X1N5K9_ECOLX|nr:Uncharacterised protein [Escherichia coli]